MTPEPDLPPLPPAALVTLADLEARADAYQAWFDALPAEEQTLRRTQSYLAFLGRQLDATEADLGQLMGWVVPEPVAPLTAREAAWVEEFMASDPADDARDVPPYPGPVGYLAAWQRELDRGQRTRFQFDALWKAACLEAEAEEVAASRPVAAMLALRDAHRVIEAAAR